MPSSRKKAKGKARKSKAKEGNLILHDDNVCRHGCEIVSKDDLRYKLVKQFEVELNAIYHSSNKSDPTREYLVGTCAEIIKRLESDEEFNVIYDNEFQKELPRLFVCLGTNILLHHSANINIGRQMAAVVAIAAVLALHDFDSNNVMASRKDRSLLRDLEDGLEYDVVRFFAKRTSCQCLKKMYSKVKSRPTAVCEICNVEKDRKLVYLCGGCRYLSYCSTICQRIVCKKYRYRH